MEAGEEVCGAVLSVRSGEDVLSVWTRNDGGRNIKIRYVATRDHVNEQANRIIGKPSSASLFSRPTPASFGRAMMRVLHNDLLSTKQDSRKCLLLVAGKGDQLSTRSRPERGSRLPRIGSAQHLLYDILIVASSIGYDLGYPQPVVEFQTRVLL